MATDGITPREFASRRRAALKAAAERGLKGLLVWSRGGNSVEAYGHVYYFTNFHSLFPIVAGDGPWVSRGHAALILPVDGDPILVTDYLDDPENRIAVKDVRVSLDVAEAAVEAMRERGLLKAKVGLAGRDSLLHSAYERMEKVAGRKLDFRPADDIVDQLRWVKSEAELALMRNAAAVGVKWMKASMNAIAEGRTEAEVVGEGMRVLCANGGVQQDVAISSGPNAGNYFGSSGVPHWNSKRKLKKGDLVHCDQWGPVDGYYTDFARSTVVGGKPTAGQRELLEGSAGVVHHIIAGAKPGMTFGDLWLLGAKWLADNDLPSPLGKPEQGGNAFSLQFPCYGHSIGLGIDGPWLVKAAKEPLKENMVLGIEALVGRAKVGAANFEQDVIIKKQGNEILTAPCPTKWWD
ncbi:MAG: Xaa-Pro peptidase family protein [Hyphomicrobiaceae bacterium]